MRRVQIGKRESGDADTCKNRALGSISFGRVVEQI